MAPVADRAVVPVVDLMDLAAVRRVDPQVALRVALQPLRPMALSRAELQMAERFPA